MKLGISTLVVDLGSEFVVVLDSWKKRIYIEGMKDRIRRLIEQDLKRLEGSK